MNRTLPAATANLSLTSFLGSSSAAAARVAEAADQLEPLALALSLILLDGRRIFFCGNGGSAAMADHLAGEFVGRFRRDRPGLPAISLTNPAIITAISNDYGYDRAFSRQLASLASPNDVLWAMTTSGNSPSVLRAIETARDEGLKIVVLTGADGGAVNGLWRSLQPPVNLHWYRAPTEDTALVQQCHLAVGHAVAAAVEALVFPEALR